MVFLLYALPVLRNWSLGFTCSEEVGAEKGEGEIKLPPAFEHSHDTKAFEFQHHVQTCSCKCFVSI